MMTTKEIKNYQPERLFLWMAIVFGLLSLIVMPIFAIPDEQVHFAGAYSVFHGPNVPIQSFADIINNISHGFPNQVTDPINKAYAWLLGGNGFFKENIFQSHRFYLKYFIQKVNFYGANSLSFHLTWRNLQYLPQAIGIVIGQLIYPSYGVMILFGRLFNFFFYIVMLYFAIKKAAFGRLPMTFVALLPMSIQMAASLSYDVGLYVVLYLAFSFFTRVWTQKEKFTRKQVVIALLLFVSFTLTKQTALIFSFYFLTMPNRLFDNSRISRGIDKIWNFCGRHKVGISFLILVAFLTGIQILFRAHGGIGHVLHLFWDTINIFGSDKIYARNILVGVVGAFGKIEYRLPLALAIIALLFFAVIVFNQTPIELEARVSVGGAMIYLTNVLAMALIMYFSWMAYLKHQNALIIEGLQGRYFTPFLICLIPMMGLPFYKKIYLNLSPKTLQIISGVFLAFLLCVYLWLTVQHYYLKTRGGL